MRTFLCCFSFYVGFKKSLSKASSPLFNYICKFLVSTETYNTNSAESVVSRRARPVCEIALSHFSQHIFVYTKTFLQLSWLYNFKVSLFPKRTGIYL